MNGAQTTDDPPCCVEVRFLDHVICSLQTTDPGKAETYAERMRDMYWGAQVRIIDGPCESSGDLPDNSALWGLTVK